MLRRHNRLLVAIHVFADFWPRSSRVRPRVSRPVRERSDSAHAAWPAAVHRATWCSRRSSGCCVVVGVPARRGSIGCAAAARAWTTSSACSSARLLAALLGVVGTLYVQTYHLSDADLKAQGFLEYLALGLGPVPGAQRALHLHVARVRPRSAAAPLARGHRPQTRAHRRRRRPRRHGGRPDPRAHASSASSSSDSWTTAPARPTRSAIAGCRCSAPTQDLADVCGREKIDEIYVALPDRRARQDARRRRVRVARVHQRARRPRPAAVHRAARPTRGPRRSAAHQRQRRAAARHEQRAEAHCRRGPVVRRRASSAACRRSSSPG